MWKFVFDDGTKDIEGTSDGSTGCDPWSFPCVAMIRVYSVVDFFS